MLFDQGEGLPGHYSNSNLYMTVLKGSLSITLDEQDTHVYPAGSLLKIPFHVKMNVRNEYEAQLELIVIKAPAVRNYAK